ncbi:MAG TPA: patatin-like phospholipase family protein [Bacteroidia bacterium]
MFNKLLENSRVRRIVFFFPFQLLFLHLKKNHLHLLFWLLLFGFVSGALAPRYGVPYLFLNPEYLNHVNFLSYFIIGFACSGFIIAFHISSYVMNGFRFPFIATLYNPFLKYSINNSIIPLAFLIVYIFRIHSFLVSEKLYTTFQVWWMITGFLCGFFVFMLMSMMYFFTTNKDIFKLFGIQTQDPKGRQLAYLKKFRKAKWKNPNLIKESRDWYVETYIGSFGRIRLVRPVHHYKREMLRKVFRQNHRNAGRFGFIAIVSLVTLGLFQDYDFFMIPAGASVFLLFTLFLMLSSALYSFFRGWANTVFILLLLLINFISRSDIMGNTNKAYGLNYETQKADYSYSTLKRMNNDRQQYSNDTAHMLSVLERWKYNNLDFSLKTNTKPKLVFVNTSGGGLRASLWTFYALQYTDSIMRGELLKHVEMITGSSGGMIGAAYLRELYYQKHHGKLDLYSTGYRNNMSKDILNPVAFSIATSELFFGLPKFRDGNYVYSKDRGYAFEKQLNENTCNILDKRLGDYRKPEEEAEVPMMVFTPSIVNDGRKLLICSQPVSFLTQNTEPSSLKNHELVDAIEYSRFFADQDAGNTRFTSVLRMNATFPYISPVVSLPSEPTIEVMDAGMRDNYGLETTVKFIYTFRKWIEENTSGVVIVQLRDKHKERPIEENPPKTLVQAMSRPLGSFYGNLFSVQDFNQDQLIMYTSAWLNTSIDMVDLQLQNEMPDNISLSWHLTNHEKEKVIHSIELPENVESINRLIQLLH